MKKVISSALVATMLLGFGATNALAIGGASGPVSYKPAGKLGAIHMNPYKVAPLTAVIMNGGYDVTDVKVVVKGKEGGGIDIKYDVSDNAVRQHGGIPVWGLYPEYRNRVEVSYKRNGEAMSETYLIYGPAVYLPGPGNNQIETLPKANVIKMDSKFKDRLYLLNHIIRASTPNSGQAVWNHPVGGAMEWDNEPYNWIIDANGDVRWYMKADEIRDPSNIYKKGNMMGFSQTKDGALLFGMGQRYMKYDLMGREIFDRRLPLSYVDFSHHIEQTPKGTYIMRVASADQKRKDGKNVRSVRDVIIEVDESGKVVDEWKIYDILDPYRDTNILALDQGAVCLNVDASKAGHTLDKEALEDNSMPFGDVAGVGVGRNWAHINSVNYDASDDSIILSVRHQSAVVKIGRDKKVKWILGAAKGWNDKFKKYLLQPVDSKGKKIVCEDEGSKCPGYENEKGGFDWTWTQHTAYVVPEKSKKGMLTVTVFDNGDSRGNEQPALASMKYSRAVEYVVDEKNMTVKQVWEYGKDRGFDWYSPITSVVEYQPNRNTMFIYSATAGLGKFLLGTGNTEPILNEIEDGTQNVKVEIRFTGLGATIGYRALPVDINKAFN
ncbi:arylsulfotransferase [Campylobacter sputorum subsp. bubulus]|uniref:Arylsulfotransferase n=1 Tax=Campylobacter sputorum subsp. sputorum TaxID=32024 RepID=A0A381DJF6_9BACT|nr:aryl-sulfate sulfotransferase [Campylobacter sputorum]ASM35810.1 arylsulfate sulfotransferase [Campylobacter sputorum aubsp. sputorum RM3237]KAB0581521.1 aryl-sulfate sulfotransferase [Campylobacter sputorum subsp. sputorum]QEL06000.1 arylsulfate sulfotransferase [Campylobacter sputorum subsp. sputorum]SUX09105.1 arylsulfotransferase [Campylobacter sputorum subsp. bubulus]SUX10796.1 arylsulfotransferase [Campylobacter sputorum subsp. sputorum]